MAEKAVSCTCTLLLPKSAALFSSNALICSLHTEAGVHINGQRCLSIRFIKTGMKIVAHKMRSPSVSVLHTLSAQLWNKAGLDNTDHHRASLSIRVRCCFSYSERMEAEAEERGREWPVTPEQGCDFNTRSPQSHYQASGRGAQGSDLIQTHTDKCKWDSAVCLNTHYAHALPSKQSWDQPPSVYSTHMRHLPRATLHEEQTHTRARASFH